MIQHLNIMFGLDQLSVVRSIRSPEIVSSVYVHWILDFAYFPGPVEIYQLESLAAILFHHNVCIAKIPMNVGCLVKRRNFRSDVSMMGVRRGKIPQRTIILRNHLHNNHAPSTWYVFEAFQCWSEAHGST